MNPTPLAENIFAKSGNTAFIRPLRPGISDGLRNKEIAFPRRPALGSTQKAGQAPAFWPGNLQTMPMTMMLQILGDWGKSATLWICSNHYLGKISLRRGKICCASITNLLVPLPPHKAFHRILSWKDGTLKLEWGEPPFEDNEICEDVSTVLKENAARRDELRNCQDQLPPGARLQVDVLPNSVKDLMPAEIDVLQMAMEEKTVQEILDAHPFSDIQIYRILLGLFNFKFISQTVDPPARV